MAFSIEIVYLLKDTCNVTGRKPMVTRQDIGEGIQKSIPFFEKKIRNKE